MEGSLYNTDNLLLKNGTKTRNKKIPVSSIALSSSVETGTTDKVSVFRDVVSLINPEYLVLADVVARIRDGQSKELITRIRQGKIHLKLQLPAICFSGEFRQRSNAGLDKYSGYIVLDYDDVSDLTVFKTLICSNPCTNCCFVSSGGQGLKVVVRVNGDSRHHAQMVEAVSKYYPAQGLEIVKDISRICFESYDPDIYFNCESRIFTL
jgi:hypothetical protein